MRVDPGAFGWVPGPVVTAIHTVGHTYRTGAAYLVAALSYYALTALMPLVLLAFVVIAFFGELEAARAAVRRFGDLLTPRGQTFILASVEDVARRTGIVVFATAVAVGSAIQLLRTLDRAIALVYGTGSAPPSDRLSVGLVVIPTAFGVGVAATAVIAVISVLGSDALFRMSVPSVVFLASAGLLFAVYTTVPNTSVSVREALPGTLFAATTWTLTGTVAALYGAYSEGAALYGILGGLLLVITWIYVANFALVFGAAINAVTSGRVDPTPGDAVPNDAPADDAGAS